MRYWKKIHFEKLPTAAHSRRHTQKERITAIQHCHCYTVTTAIQQHSATHTALAIFLSFCSPWLALFRIFSKSFSSHIDPQQIFPRYPWGAPNTVFLTERFFSISPFCERGALLSATTSRNLEKIWDLEKLRNKSRPHQLRLFGT